MTSEHIPHGTIQTPYGPIYPTVGPCRDDYLNIRTRTTPSGTILKLQLPAIRAWERAELRNGRKYPWRKHRTPKAIPVTGTWRSCAEQTQLHNDDPQRYADPNGSRHCRGLAGDVNTAFLTRRVKRCLAREGFHMPRADEPWHWSYYENG